MSNWDEKKLDDMFWMFSSILPTGSEETRTALEAALGKPLNELLPILMHSISQICKDNPETALGYFEFIEQGIQYIKGTRKDPPEVDYDPEDFKRLWNIRQIQLNKTKKKLVKKNDQ